jgi:hypothetical protein
MAERLVLILALRSVRDLEDVAVRVDLIQQGAQKFHQRLARHHPLLLFQCRLLSSLLSLPALSSLPLVHRYQEWGSRWDRGRACDEQQAVQELMKLT